MITSAKAVAVIGAAIAGDGGACARAEAARARGRRQRVVARAPGGEERRKRVTG